MKSISLLSFSGCILGCIQFFQPFENLSKPFAKISVIFKLTIFSIFCAVRHGTLLFYHSLLYMGAFLNVRSAGISFYIKKSLKTIFFNQWVKTNLFLFSLCPRQSSCPPGHFAPQTFYWGLLQS